MTTHIPVVSDPLTHILNETSKIFEYDYNKMLEHFKFEEIRHKKAKERMKFLKKKDKIWKEKLDHMKTSQSDFIKKRREKILMEINDKNANSSKLLKQKYAEKNEQKKKIISERMNKEAEVKDKINEHFRKIEKKRLLDGQRTKAKIALYSERNMSYLNEIKEMHINHQEEAMRKFKEHLKLVLEANEEAARKNAEATFERYLASYKRSISKKETQKQKKKEHLIKLENKKERMEELELKNEERREAIIKKLEDLTKKKEEIDQQHSLYISKLIQKEQDKLRSLMKRKKSINSERDLRSSQILEKQTYILNKANMKDTIVNVKRLNAYENTIVYQMEIEKRLNTFCTQMNRLKDQSMLKKSNEQKLGIYLELKRKEEERIKKELEDKKNI